MNDTKRRMTPERLGQLEEAVNAMDAGARSSTCYHPSVVDELITELRAERTENARLRERCIDVYELCEQDYAPIHIGKRAQGMARQYIAELRRQDAIVNQQEAE